MRTQLPLDRRLVLQVTAAFLICISSWPAMPDQAPPIHAGGYELTWSEEFDKAGRPNPEIWSFEQGFRRNDEDQWYQSENAWCEDGRLIIEARRADQPNPGYRPGSESWRHKRRRIHYTSASVKTRDKKQWLYGRLEVRTKIDVGPGLWPAIWTLGSARRWPGCGEVDVMEYYDNSLLANAAWSSGRRYRPTWDSAKVPLKQIAKDESVSDWAKRFHTWRMDWTEDSIKLYVDGKLLNEIDVTKTINRSKDKANPFREPHFLILNLAIGGDRGGNPEKTDFPRRMEVDYVRLYQQKETNERVP